MATTRLCQWKEQEPQSLERRIYFDPAARPQSGFITATKSCLLLSTTTPNFFHKEADAVGAVIGAENSNPDYNRRPDERPWSERHKWVLWGSLLLSVVVLALLALKGLTSGPAARK